MSSSSTTLVPFATVAFYLGSMRVLDSIFELRVRQTIEAMIHEVEKAWWCDLPPTPPLLSSSCIDTHTAYAGTGAG